MLRVSARVAFVASFLGACSSAGATSDAGGGLPHDDAAASGIDTGGTAGGGTLPCDVNDVVVTHCQTCHAATPVYGAPMPLVTHADWVAPAISNPAEQVLQRAMARVHDTASPMPPITQPPLDAPSLATLDAWLAAGAPAGTTGTCTPPPPPPPPDTLPCTPTHTFLSHASGDETAPFALPVGSTNQYMCFVWRSPFTTSQQATAWGPVIGDERVVHHWILWRTTTAQTDGFAGPCNVPSNAAFLMGWAPGGGVFEMPPDVGLELREGTGDEYLILQLHYNNPMGHADVLDHTGVELCTTDTPRAQAAGVLALGTTRLNIPPRSSDVSMTGTCPSLLTNLLSAPLHVISSGPHMHQLGRRFVTDLLPGGTGAPENMVTIDAWNFGDQIAYTYDPPRIINPGDALRTTCTYSNPGADTVSFGERTEDEMCFNFMMVYPIDILPAGVPRYCSDS